MRPSIPLLLCCLINLPLRAAPPPELPLKPLPSLDTHSEDHTFMLEATVNEAPPSIELHWPDYGLTQDIHVYRKTIDEPAFGSVHATLPSTATAFVDTDVAIGEPWEYQLRSGSRYGYLYGGVRAPMPEHRGTLLLVVDASHLPALEDAVTTLTRDLIGDGWRVRRCDVARDAPTTAVKAALLDAWSRDPEGVRAALLFGHVPVPYSGNINPDGHGNHVGAWAADTFYADMSSLEWPDTSVNNTSASRAENHNVPGDGKWDTSYLYGNDLELMVGRVDCANMPAFDLDEAGLLRQYVDKAHRYRHGLTTATARALVRDNFTGYTEGFAQNGWRLAAQVGLDRVAAGSWDDLRTGSYLWSYGCGGGSYTSAGGVASTNGYAGNVYQALFQMLFGSYHGDWDSTNNFLRAPICMPDYGLTCAWAGRPHWQFHHMALGEPIGRAAVISVSGYYTSGFGARGVHAALMGDPTLRLHYPAPVGQVSARATTGSVRLQWTEPAGPAPLEYRVYRARSLDHGFSRIATRPAPATAFIDAAPLAGPGVYMVRAMTYTTTAGGTHENLSQGVFAEASFVGARSSGVAEAWRYR